MSDGPLRQITRTQLDPIRRWVVTLQCGHRVIMLSRHKPTYRMTRCSECFHDKGTL